MLVQPADLAGATRPFLCFETVTLAPFDRRMIDRALLTPAEVAWLDAYHARVRAEVAAAVEPAVRDWLTIACAPLGD